MKKIFSKALTAVTLFAFSVSYLAPLANAKAKARTLSDSVASYEKARSSYAKSGLESFLKALPYKFSKPDVRFFVAQMKGVTGLPEIKVENGDTVVVSAKTKAGTEKVTLQVINLEKSEFAIDGVKFQGGNSLETLTKAAIAASAPKKTSSFRLIDWLIPSALADDDKSSDGSHEAGSITKAVLITLAAVAVVGLAIWGGIYLYNRVKEQNYDRGYEDGKLHGSGSTSTSSSTVGDVAVSTSSSGTTTTAASGTGTAPTATTGTTGASVTPSSTGLDAASVQR